MAGNELRRLLKHDQTNRVMIRSATVSGIWEAGWDQSPRQFLYFNNSFTFAASLVGGWHALPVQR
jgi:hypothetical protein